MIGREAVVSDVVNEWCNMFAYKWARVVIKQARYTRNYVT